MPSAHQSILTIDLAAIRANWRLLKDRHAKKTIAAVVKADAYGLGFEKISEALWEEGCREFFVATLEEGGALSEVLPPKASIAVFNGLTPGKEETHRLLNLSPVLNDVGQVERALKQKVIGKKQRMIIHVDTGMTRLGLSQPDLKKLADQSLIPDSQSLLLISHLACANEPDHPKNAEQLLRFKEALSLFPEAQASLCNSSGLFLSPDFHFDLGRPGCAIYGITPVSGDNPMQPVATLSAPFLQVRTLDRDENVGYGAMASAKKGSRIAILSLGYADGWMRALSNKGFAYVEGQKVPILGRVSMDMLALDLSAVPEAKITASTRAEFLNKQQTVNDIAAACGTIGYEIFTRIGPRVIREYRS